MTALAVPHVVEQIGSYAGFVAVIGLAVLSALYISQARDLRRLRDWAGRAPERAAEQAARGVAQPVPGKTVTAVPRPPAQQPKPAATPAVAGAAAATSGAKAEETAAAGTATAPAGAPAAATPAGAAAASNKDSEDKPGEAAGDGSPPEVAPVPVATAGAKEEAGEKQQDEQPSEEPAASNGSPPDAPAAPPPPPARPPRPAAPPPRRAATLPASRPSQTAIPPRPGSKRAGGRRGPDPRYIALAAVGVLVIGAGAAVGIPKLLEEDDGAPATQREQQAGSTSTGAPAVAPEEITVSVLNGTTVPGLAAQVGDQVENEGFVLGNVTNAAEQQRADSIVMYAPGHTRDARLVARRLRLNRTVEPVDPDSQGLAGDATVVVVVGQDQTR